MSIQHKLSNEIDLNSEFRSILEEMENTGSNMLITGKAGTGKSTLLEYFRSVTLKNVAVLAPTGVAALNIKGQTIHSFFHFKPDITPDTVHRVGRVQSFMYKALDMIIVDEISMVRADLFDCMDRFMRLNGRDASLPFGGAQLVLIGDLYQLPPVVTREEEDIFRGHYASQYFFDSNAFGGMSFRHAELRTHYRQKDEKFIGLLNAIRTNTATDRHLRELNDRFDPIFRPKESDTYITLTSTNRLADSINEDHLKGLFGVPHTYHGELKGEFDRKLLPTDETLTLKQGAQVMLLSNDKEKRWVNGSIGKIASITHYETGDEVKVDLIDGGTVEVGQYTWDLYRFSYDEMLRKLVSKKIGSFTQYPIMLAWAVTIHKSQGKTFDRVIVDVGQGTFAHGQLYVALSRCTTLDGLVLRNLVKREHIIMDDRVVQFLGRLDGAKG